MPVNKITDWHLARQTDSSTGFIAERHPGGHFSDSQGTEVMNKESYCCRSSKSKLWGYIGSCLIPLVHLAWFVKLKAVFRSLSSSWSTWRHQGLNLGPSAAKACALSLSCLSCSSWPPRWVPQAYAHKFLLRPLCGRSVKFHLLCPSDSMA